SARDNPSYPGSDRFHQRGGPCLAPAARNPLVPRHFDFRTPRRLPPTGHSQKYLRLLHLPAAPSREAGPGDEERALRLPPFPLPIFVCREHLHNVSSHPGSICFRRPLAPLWVSDLRPGLPGISDCLLGPPLLAGAL